MIGQEAHDRENKTGVAPAVCLTNAVSGEGVAELVAALEAALARSEGQARRQKQLRAFSRLLLDIELRQNWLKPFVEGEAGARFFADLDGGASNPADIIEAFWKSVQ